MSILILDLCEIMHFKNNKFKNFTEVIIMWPSQPKGRETMPVATHGPRPPRVL